MASLQRRPRLRLLHRQLLLLPQLLRLRGLLQHPGETLSPGLARRHGRAHSLRIRGRKLKVDNARSSIKASKGEVATFRAFSGEPLFLLGANRERRSESQKGVDGLPWIWLEAERFSLPPLLQNHS